MRHELGFPGDSEEKYGRSISVSVVDGTGKEADVKGALPEFWRQLWLVLQWQRHTGLLSFSGKNVLL